MGMAMAMEMGMRMGMSDGMLFSFGSPPRRAGAGSSVCWVIKRRRRMAMDGWTDRRACFCFLEEVVEPILLCFVHSFCFFFGFSPFLFFFLLLLPLFLACLGRPARKHQRMDRCCGFSCHTSYCTTGGGRVFGFRSQLLTARSGQFFLCRIARSSSERWGGLVRRFSDTAVYWVIHYSLFLFAVWMYGWLDFTTPLLRFFVFLLSAQENRIGEEERPDRSGKSESCFFLSFSFSA